MEEEDTQPSRTIPYPPGVHPIYETYPCKKKEEEAGQYSLPCKQISISIPEGKEQPPKKKEKQKEKKEAPRPPSKKKFEEFKETKTCSLPFSRTWVQGEIGKRQSNELPKWFSRRREPVARPKICPRELDDYEKKLWIPICKKEEEEKEECKVPIDENLCVFCLKSLYLHGYIHDLFEKVPKVKKQSEKYGDDIAERIGIRTRITVHKNCYDDYIDFISHKKDNEDEESEEEEEDDEDMTCEVKGNETEQDEDEDEGGEGKGKDMKKKGRRPKAQDLSILPKKPCFCLKKFQIPKIDSGESTDGVSLRSRDRLSADPQSPWLKHYFAGLVKKIFSFFIDLKFFI